MPCVKIYTKTGDRGETSLLSGGRVAKDHRRISAYGTLDELNSVIGVLLAEGVPEGAAVQLGQVQRVLFSLGAALADVEGRYAGDRTDWNPEVIEGWIDTMDSQLPPLTNFILPGGCRAAALAHVARTVCRRAEREVVAAERDTGGSQPGVLEYLNRLSDGLFVLARWLNSQAGVAECPWRRDEG
jgi:cob(I)alamin adenosyltransferase